ncbi:MAG: hypothetical protein OXE42_16935 [Gammaproteobacteria bacterium]|nr:hypothetical protein [Gammaproteobacteria bacterium]
MTLPAQNLTSHLARADLLFRQNEAPRWRKSVGSGHEPSSPDSGALVKYLFSSVTSPTLMSGLPASHNETVALRKAVELLLEATEDGTLTENEADTMIQLLAERFTLRRFNQIFERISNIDESNWFLAASRLSRHE